MEPAAFRAAPCVALRLGYLQDSSQQASSLGGQFQTAGLGLAWEGWHLDYGWDQDPGSLGSLQRVSLSYAFAPAPTWTKTASAPKPTPVPTAVALGLTVTADPQRFEPSANPKGLLIWVQSGGLDLAARSRVDIIGPQGLGVAFKEVSGVARSFTWDGRKPGVGPAEPGDYHILMLVWDGAGNTLASAQSAFQLVTGPGPLILQPQADSFAPLAQSSRPQARVDVSWGGDDAVRWTLSVAKLGAARPLRVLSGPGLPGQLSWQPGPPAPARAGRQLSIDPAGAAPGRPHRQRPGHGGAGHPPVQAGDGRRTQGLQTRAGPHGRAFPDQAARHGGPAGEMDLAGAVPGRQSPALLQRRRPRAGGARMGRHGQRRGGGPPGGFTTPN